MDFEVERADLHKSRVVDEEPSDPEPGQALLRVDAFGLTANNVTYGVVGETLRYWDFFPTDDPDTWGRIPVWGFADVVASNEPGVAEGDRVYGYLPMSTHLTVNPGRVDQRGFADVAAHRVPLPGAYNRYRRVGEDPVHAPEREDQQMLLWPLFATSFLIDDFLDDNGLLDGATVLISSASSKTAIGTAFQVARRKAGKITGLTSPGNVDFVEGLDVYGHVVTYDDVASLPETDAVYVDIAGSGTVRADVHRRFGDRLAHSMAVGATHWDEPPGPSGELDGPAPTFFFAPSQVAKRAEDWGPAGLDERMGAAWREFVEFSDGWLQIQHGKGPDTVERAYREVLDGRTDPATGHVLSMWEE